MQGFFVEATNDGDFGVTNAAKNETVQNFYKKGLCEMLSLEVTSEMNQYMDEVFVCFHTNASTGFDLDFDGHKLPGLDDAPQFYAFIPGYDMSINTLPEITENSEIDLGFSCGISGDFTIKFKGVESFGSEVQLYLKDIMENTMINLRESEIYTFSYSTGDEAERFKLFISSPQGISDIIGVDVNIYSFDNTIKISSSEVINGELIVYNIMGKKILSQEINSNESSIILNAARGTYLIKFVTDKGIITKKVYVN